MKKIFLLIMAGAPTLVWAQHQNFELKGKIGNINKPMKIYLAKAPNAGQVIDSSDFVNGNFSINGKLDVARNLVVMVAPSLAELPGGSGASGPGAAAPAKMTPGATGPAMVRRVMPDLKFFYLDKGVTTLNSPDSLKRAVIDGASKKVNEEAAELQKVLDPIRNENGSIGQMWGQASEEQRKSEEFMKAYYTRIKAIDEKQKDVVAAFIKAHPNSGVSLSALLSQMGSAAKLPDFKAAFAALSPELQNSEMGKAFEAKIKKMESTAIGATAPDFTQPDNNGKMVKLSDFRGQYVLIDFWASWCVPCRKENPNVKKVYEKFKDKNFTVLGISLDKTRELWLKAIETDGLTWTNVSDLKDFGNEAAKAYAVNAIPTNYLINPEGKIIASNLRGVELEEKIAELIKQ